MIDDFLTSPDDLPPVRLRHAPRIAPDESDDVAWAASAAVPAALAAGVLLAATVIGNPPAADDSAVTGASTSASRTT